MVTEKEFLEIVEKHLVIQADGSVCIKDSELAKKYEEYLKEHAQKDGGTKSTNGGCINLVYCA